MSSPVLDRRSLNRATLARQLLLERVAMSPYEATARLVGIQAQEPQSWYLTFWSRLAPFDSEEVGRLILDRRLVRLPLMRSTIHLVTDDDAGLLRAFTQPVIERSLRGQFARRLEGVDLEEVETMARAIASEAPPTPAALTRALLERWPHVDPLTMANAVRARVPLVQVPPRGMWRRSGAVRLAPLDTWLGRPLPALTDPGPIVIRYLAAYGPASVRDVQQWSGVSRLGEVLERLRPQLQTFRDESGRELFDLRDAPRPDPATPAPVRFLADYDNLLLSHADRSRFGDERNRAALTYVEGPYPSSLMIDGQLAGQWHVRREGGSSTVVVRVMEPISPDGEAAIRSEAMAMLAFREPELEDPALEIEVMGT
jgi:hypothetical protein